MNQLVSIADNANMVALIKRTICKDLDCVVDRKGVRTPENFGEFEIFMANVRHLGLDPLRKQIYPFVFHKADRNKRQLVIVTGIGGYRTIAERTGNYMPGPTALVIDDSIEDDPANVQKILYAEATVKKFSHGEWHEIVERAYWDEFAPILEEPVGGFFWKDTGDKYGSGHPKEGEPIKVKTPASDKIERKLDPKREAWTRMPKLMLEKCAEAKALRRAWPDDFGRTYVEEELHKGMTLDLTATEMAEKAESAARLGALGGAGLTVDWLDGAPLARIPVGKFGDKVIEFMRANDPSTVAVFRDRNKETLREYWAHDKSGALELKKHFEKALASDAEIQKA